MSTSAVSAAVLPSVRAQAARLLELGLHEHADDLAEPLRALADGGDEHADGLLLAVRPEQAPASLLAPLLRRGDRAGFVVADMVDVDDFAPLPGLEVPETALYLVEGLDRGDDLRNRSPDEALSAFGARGRSPLLLTEGLHWVIQAPDVLERNRCFMTIGSRLRRPDGRLDARTPAVWISNGTGRDGRERRDAPKTGWCWAGNRHTWLGFASATARRAAGPARTA